MPPQVRSLALLALFALFALLGPGCAIGTLQRPRTITKGSRQITAGIGMTQVAQPGQQAVNVPMVEAGLRLGISPNADVGVKASMTSVAADGKWQLLRGTFDFAVGAGVGLGGYSNGVSVDATVPLIAAVNLGDAVALVAAARPMARYLVGFSSSSPDGLGLWGGGSFGVAITLGRTFTIIPEIAVSVPLALPPGANNGVFYQLAVGFAGGAEYSGLSEDIDQL